MAQPPTRHQAAAYHAALIAAGAKTDRDYATRDVRGLLISIGGPVSTATIYNWFAIWEADNVATKTKRGYIRLHEPDDDHDPYAQLLEQARDALEDDDAPPEQAPTPTT